MSHRCMCRRITLFFIIYGPKSQIWQPRTLHSVEKWKYEREFSSINAAEKKNHFFISHFCIFIGWIAHAQWRRLHSACVVVHTIAHMHTVRKWNVKKSPLFLVQFYGKRRRRRRAVLPKKTQARFTNVWTYTQHTAHIDGEEKRTVLPPHVYVQYLHFDAHLCGWNVKHKIAQLLCVCDGIIKFDNIAPFVVIIDDDYRNHCDDWIVVVCTTVSYYACLWRLRQSRAVIYWNKMWWASSPSSSSSSTAACFTFSSPERDLLLY
jgi:hypothetical protein